jgi:hypothetical protein
MKILYRIDAGGDVAVGAQQAEHGLRLEGDVGIDPEQVCEGFIRQEFQHDLVATAGDQAFAVQVEDAVEPEMRGIERHAEDARHIVHRDPEM